MNGKSLSDLTHEIVVERRALVAPAYGLAEICWQEDGTLCFFDPEGFPAFYWLEGYGVKDNFMNYAWFLDALVGTSDEETYLLLTDDVWRATDTPEDIQQFNALLGDIQIDL